MGTGHALAQHGGAGRLHGHHLHVGVLLFQVFANAGHGAAGAHTGNENIHLAIGILPDFRAGGCLVNGGIGGVYKLAGDEATRDFLCQFIGLGNGTLHALGTLGEHQLCAVGLHNLAALHTHGLGHHNDDAVAAGGCHGGKANAGIAGGWLNNHSTGLQQPLLLGIINHGLGNAILYAAGRVEIFQLSQNLCFQVFGLLNVNQLQQRGLANQLVGRCINFTHYKFLPNDSCSCPFISYPCFYFWQRQHRRI